MEQGASKQRTGTDEGGIGEVKPCLGLRKKRRGKISTYEMAKKVYESIQVEKRQQRLLRKQEREGRRVALEKYEKNKKKTNKVLRKRNKKGQPNLGAQMEVLLEKIEQEVK